MLVVASMVGMGGRGSSLASCSGGPIIMGQPARVLGTRIARQGIALAVREGERYALMGPNGFGKALVVAALFGLQLYFSRTGGSLVAAVVDPSLLGSGAAAAGGM